MPVSCFNADPLLMLSIAYRVTVLHSVNNSVAEREALNVLKHVTCLFVTQEKKRQRERLIALR